MFKPTTSFLFAVVFLFRLTVFSAPPPKEVGTSDIEIKAHIAYVGRMVPFSKHNTKAMLDSQRETLAILREKFPKYDEWMKDKPNPQLADIFERNVTYQQKVELVEETFKSVRGDVQQRIEAELRQMPALASIAEKFSWLEARGLSKLKNDLTTNNDSVRGVIVGLAQLLDGSEKAQFFKLGNPEAQLEYLEKKGLTTEQLRSGAFRPEQVGLSRESVTIDAVFNLVRSKLDRSSEILNSLAYLKAISLAKSAGVTDISRVSSQLNAAEFDFAYRTSSDFLREVAVQMASKENLPETAFAQWMRSFQSNLPKAIFHTSLHAVENRKLIGSIYEAPPHLAVYRGCIGGDCSTTRSAFYPYSPWEHVFYIKNERNEFVGYASVTRVKSKGVETFYLKDLTGANMSPEVARAAMFAFRQMISAYGAKRFAIASPTFTNAQNHNSSIVRMLGEYNKSSDRVPLKFQDAAIRDVLRNELKVAYQTSSAYDDPRSHEEGVLLSVREPDAVRYAVEVKAGGLPEYSTEELAAELVRVIREVIVNRQKVEGISRILTTSEIEEAVRVITNKGKFSLIGYYRTVNKLFAQYGIQFSRDWLIQDRVLFVSGYLRVADIMMQADFWKNLALRHFFDSIDQGVNLLEVQDFFAKWKSQLFRTPEYKEAIHRMGQRLSHQDIYLLFAFAEQGSHAAQAVIRDPKNRPQVESAIAAYIKNESEFEFITREPTKSQQKVGFGIMGYTINKVEDYTRKELKSRLAKILKEFRLKRSDIQSDFIQNRFDILFLFAKDSFDKGYVKSHRILQEKIDKNLITRLELLNLWMGLNMKHPLVTRQVQQRVNQLMKTKSQEDILELQALHSLGALPATKALSTLAAAPEVESLLKNLLAKNVVSREDAPYLSKESFEIFDFIKARSDSRTWYLDSLREHLEDFRGDSADSTLKKLKEWFTEFGARAEVVMSWPVTMKLISSDWLSQTDVFNSKDPDVISNSIRFLTYRVRAGRDDANVWKDLFSNIRYVQQNPEFRKMIDSIQKGFFEGNCPSCARAMVLFTLSGNISPELLRSREAIARLLTSDQPVSKTYALIYAAEVQATDMIGEHLQLEVLRLLISGFGSFPAAFIDPTKEKVLVALGRSAGNSSAFRMALLDFIANTAINSHALVAVEIYLAQDGDAKRALKALTQNYPRRELEFPGYDPHEAGIYWKLKNLVEKNESARLKTCRSLFGKAG